MRIIIVYEMLINFDAQFFFEGIRLYETNQHMLTCKQLTKQKKVKKN